jgi:ABC-type nitrate/sulfonate/bicarbonate transport system substrate-binding protein
MIAPATILPGCIRNTGVDSRATQQPGFAITLGELSSSTSHTPVYVAEREGFFSKAGLKVSIQQLSGGTPAAMAAFSNGQIDVMLASANEFIEYSVNKVISGKIFGELVDASYDLVTSPGIAEVEQLRGKIIGISGPNGADQIYLQALLPHYGLKPEEVTFLTTGSPGNRLTALATGSIQAAAVGFGSRTLSAKVGKILLAASDSPVGIPGDLFFASQPLLNAHPGELKHFLAALVEASAWIHDHPSAAASDCMHVAGLSLELCQGGVTTLTDPKVAGKYTWSSTFAVNATAVASALQIASAHDPGISQVRLESLVDLSIAVPSAQ